MGFRRKGSSSTTQSESDHQANVIWHNVGIPCPTATLEDSLLEANYAAYYQSETYNEISAVAADLPVAHPTLDPGSIDYIGYPMQRPSFAHAMVFESQDSLIDPLTPAVPEPVETVKNACPLHGQQSTADNDTAQWPGKFDPAGFSNWSSIPGTNNTDYFRSQSDAGIEQAPRVEVPVRSRSDAGHRTSLIPVDISTPWNPTFPPYSKYYQPPVRKSPEQEQEEDGSGVGRPVEYEGNRYRLSELIDPADLVPEQDRYDAFSISTASYSSRSSSLDRGSSRSVSPASSIGSRTHSRKTSLPDSKPLPPVLESPAGALFSASEFVAHPNRPLAIRERQEQIRAAIQNLDSESRLARSASRKGSASDSTAQWKTGFGCDNRKGSKSSGSGIGGTAYGGFGVDNRGASNGEVMTLEQIKIEEGRRAYEARKEKGERSWGLSALRGRRGS